MLDTNHFYDVFLIFDPSDIRFVRQLDAQLKARGIECWLKGADYGITDEGRRELRAGILRSHTVAFALSPDSAASPICSGLIQYAITHSKGFITLILDEDIEADIHPAIAENPYIFFRESDDFAARSAELLTLLAVNPHLKLHTELLVRAENWQRQRRAGDFLLPPERVAEARQWLQDGANRLPKPSPLQVEFIHASRRQKSAVQRSRPLYGLLSAALLMALVLVIGLQSRAAQQAAASETALAQTTQQGATQQALALTASATAQAASTAAVLAANATHSASIVDAIQQTAQVERQQTQTAGIPLTAQAHLQATQSALSSLKDEVGRILRLAQGALDDGDADLAAALAKAAADLHGDPRIAYPILQRADAAESAQVFADAQTGTAIDRSGSALLLVGEADFRLLYIAEAQSTFLRADSAITRINPSGTHFASHSQDTLTLYAAENAAEIQSWQLAAAIQDLWLSDSGSPLLAGGRGGELWLLRAENTAAVQLPSADFGPATAAHFAADGSRFITLHDQRAVLWETAAAAVQQSHPLGFAAAEKPLQVAFSPSGENVTFFLEVESGLAGMSELSLEDGAFKRTAFIDVQHGEFSASGEHLLLARDDRSVQIIDIASGRVERHLPPQPGSVRRLVYQRAPQERLFVAADSQLLVWNLEFAVIDWQHPHPQPVLDFTVSADGGGILTRDDSDVHRLWTTPVPPSGAAFAAVRALSCAERGQHQIPPLCAEPQ